MAFLAETNCPQCKGSDISDCTGKMDKHPHFFCLECGYYWPESETKANMAERFHKIGRQTNKLRKYRYKNKHKHDDEL